MARFCLSSSLKLNLSMKLLKLGLSLLSHSCRSVVVRHFKVYNSTKEDDSVSWLLVLGLSRSVQWADNENRYKCQTRTFFSYCMVSFPLLNVVPVYCSAITSWTVQKSDSSFDVMWGFSWKWRWKMVKREKNAGILTFFC